jgi:hypothetical protein
VAHTHRQLAEPDGVEVDWPGVVSRAVAAKARETVFARTDLLFADGDALCEANGIAYFHFLQPNQYVEGTKPMAASEQAVALNVENPYRAPAVACYPLLIEEGRSLKAQGINFHDLTRVFAEHSEPLYVDDCCHFNDAGDKILAENIAAAIRSVFEQPRGDRPR